MCLRLSGINVCTLDERLPVFPDGLCRRFCTKMGVMAWLGTWKDAVLLAFLFQNGAFVQEPSH